MGIFDKFQKGLNKGLEESKSIFSKARDKAKTLGDQGVLAFEVQQLQKQRKALLMELGEKTYELLVAESKQSVSKKTPDLKELFDQLSENTRLYEEKSAALEEARAEEEKEEPESQQTEKQKPAKSKPSAKKAKESKEVRDVTPAPEQGELTPEENKKEE